MNAASELHAPTNASCAQLLIAVSNPSSTVVNVSGASSWVSAWFAYDINPFLRAPYTGEQLGEFVINKILPRAYDEAAERLLDELRKEDLLGEYEVVLNRCSRIVQRHASREWIQRFRIRRVLCLSQCFFLGRHPWRFSGVFALVWRVQDAAHRYQIAPSWDESERTICLGLSSIQPKSGHTILGVCETSRRVGRHRYGATCVRHH